MHTIPTTEQTMARTCLIQAALWAEPPNSRADALYRQLMLNFNDDTLRGALADALAEAGNLALAANLRGCGGRDVVRILAFDTVLDVIAAHGSAFDEVEQVRSHRQAVDRFRDQWEVIEGDQDFPLDFSSAWRVGGAAWTLGRPGWDFRATLELPAPDGPVDDSDPGNVQHVHFPCEVNGNGILSVFRPPEKELDNILWHPPQPELFDGNA